VVGDSRLQQACPVDDPEARHPIDDLVRRLHRKILAAAV